MAAKILSPNNFIKQLNQLTKLTQDNKEFIKTLYNITGITPKRLFVIDFEALNNTPIGFAFGNGRNIVFVPATESTLEQIINLLRIGNTIMIAHNLKYDFSMLMSVMNISPAEFRKFTKNNIFIDTLLLHHLYNPEASHKLKVLAYEFTKLGGYEGDIGSAFWKSEIWKTISKNFLSWASTDTIPEEVEVHYSNETSQLISSLLKFGEPKLIRLNFTDLREDTDGAKIMQAIAYYSITDASITIIAAKKLLKKLLSRSDEIPNLLKHIIFKLPVALTSIEHEGLKVDIPQAEILLENLNNMLDVIMSEIQQLFKEQIAVLKTYKEALTVKEAKDILRKQFGRVPSKNHILEHLSDYINNTSNENIKQALIRLYINIAELEDIIELQEVNIRSPIQLIKVLKAILLLSAKTNEDLALVNNLDSTREEKFEQLYKMYGDDHPLGKIIKLILEYRKHFKLVSTYVKPYLTLIDENDRLHPEFKQTGTVTGRLCLAQDTIVYSNNNEKIPLYKVKQGTKIFSPFSSTNLAEVTTVYKTVLPGITLYAGDKQDPYKITASPHHRFLVKVKTQNILSWLEVKDIIKLFSTGTTINMVIYDGTLKEVPLIGFASAGLQHMIDIEVEYTPAITDYGRRTNAFIANHFVSHNSSANPNVQNVPKGSGIRELIIPREGYKLIEADYSQVELRVIAAVANEEQLIQAFKEGKDIHRATAALVLNKPEEEITDEERRSAKAINFGIIYGMGAKSLAERLEISEEEAQKLINQYFNRFPRLKQWIEGVRKMAREKGYVETYFGRRRILLPDIISPDRGRAAVAEREASNTPIQGTASDLTLSSITLLSEILPDDTFIVNTVHDSIIIECPEHKVEEIVNLIRSVMENPPILHDKHPLKRVPIKVDIEILDRWH